MATSTSIARSSARWICGTSVEQLGDEVVEKAKTCLADMIGIAAQASDLPASRHAVAFAIAMGGNQATIVGSRQRASIADAAFANAVMAHGLVQEDMHTASVSHIGIVVWPTLLALAEYTRASGEDFVAAGVAGYQVMARLGRALMTKEVASAFRPTGLVGAIGGAAGGARLLGLSEDETTSALALAANTAAGLNQWPLQGSDDMFFHPGNAARNAVTSVLLAKAGARAAESCLNALLPAYGGPPRDSLPLEGGWEVLEVYHKPAPACNYAQTPAQAALAALQKSPLRVADIEHVVVKTFPEAIAYPGCHQAGPFRTLLQAKMSIQFVVAATLAAGRLDDAALREFSEASDAARLARRVRLESDLEFAAAYPQRQGAEVIVTLKTVERRSARLPALQPLDARGVQQRFVTSVSRLLGEARATDLAREIDALPALRDAARISRLLAP
ncbi:MAG: MmgE/PrpD family protein [Burkholderiales bacterium]